MQYRPLGRTGWHVSEVSFGAWAIGGSWGPTDDDAAMKALHTAIDEGVNFIDTADVYGDGHSERLIRRLLAERDERIYVATKAGRRLNPHTAEGYTKANLTAFIERSLENLGVERLDLVQLHCPPTEVYYRPEVFGALDDLVAEGKIAHYGVSVEKVEEALKAIEYPNVETVQIIFNPLRQRPSTLFFEMALRRSAGVIVRVPLASGLLTGKYDADATFPEGDHRNFNREGEAFDVGETFAGVPFEQGLQAVDELRDIVPEGWSMAQFTLRWILMFAGVSCIIPGARKPAHVTDNSTASGLPPLTADQMQIVRQVYEHYAFAAVHHRW